MAARGEPQAAASARRLRHRRGQGTEVAWVEPTYHAVHTILTHPAYAGAYVYGRTRKHTYVGQDGTVRTRHKAARGEWEVLIRDHHAGYLDWDTYEANRPQIGNNIRPEAHQPGTGAVREGCALLQGLATCGTCGRKLTVFYQGPAKATPGYYCQGPGTLIDGRGTRHLHVGGVALDTAVADAFLAALPPEALTACLTAAEHLEDAHDAALDQHRRQVERARYQASRAERRYQAVDPDNRLVARGLETAWENALTELAAAEADLARREQTRPRALTDTERADIRALGDDLHQVCGRAHDHRPRPQAAAAHPDRRREGHRRARRRRRPRRPAPPLEGRRAHRTDRRWPAPPATRSAPTRTPST